MERVLRHPQNYEHVFKTPYVTEQWQDPQMQTVELFNEKYADGWRYFCTQNNICRTSEHGPSLRVPRERVFDNSGARYLGRGAFRR